MNTTTRNDPLARAAVIGLIAVALWASFAQLQPRAEAQTDPGDIIILATPALPTPALGDDPALVIIPIPTPDWPVTSQEPFLGTETNETGQDKGLPVSVPTLGPEYAATIAEQAEHSPRGDVAHPPAFDSGPVLDPGPSVIVEVLPLAVGVAVAVPALSAEQAAVIGARTSNTCAPGEVFYPRTGCHVPGSGGPMPGAVGER